jgi:NAD-dependent SIR2 family protein deacetylase
MRALVSTSARLSRVRHWPGRVAQLQRQEECVSQDARESLIRDVTNGSTTFVLGAGVAGACDVATWRELAAGLWAEAFNRELPEAADDPRFYPFALEKVKAAIPDEFARSLKRTLYAKHRLPSREELIYSPTNTLAVLARIIADQARAPSRRLVRVLTLNVDDVLERAVTRVLGRRTPPPITSIVRAAHQGTNIHPGGALPIYHLHGYLGSDESGEAGEDADTLQDASDVLVFTDLQYWASAATPSSHMNRTFSFALHDSHCVFIGTSMADLNIWRWLALRAFEMASDCRNECDSARSGAGREAEQRYQRALSRHYWITSGSEEDVFLSDCLSLRGVSTVQISGWQDSSFHELMSACFPSARAAHAKR